MSALKSTWDRIIEQRTLSLGVSAGVIVLGALLIAAGELNDLGWTRIIGAGVISLAATVLGLLIGWSDPFRPTFAAVLSDWRKLLATFLILLIVAPVIVGMVLGFGGLIVGGGDTDAILMLVGILITFVFLVLTAITVGTAVNLAMQALNRDGTKQRHHTNGRGEP